MKHLFLNKELSLVAKEKGFDEPCFAFYNEEELIRHLFRNIEQCRNSEVDGIAAPLYQQIIDWFIKKYFINITIHYECSVNEAMDIYARINFMISEFLHQDVIVRGDGQFPTREEVLNKAIKETFELIK